MSETPRRAPLAAAPSWSTTFLERREALLPLLDVQEELVGALLDRHPHPIARFLDLGCGDGAMSELVLDASPAPKPCWSTSPSRCSRGAGERLGGPRSLAGACAATSTTRAGATALPAGPLRRRVSALAIHHLPAARKRALFAELFALLEPGGMFVNMDYVAVDGPLRGPVRRADARQRDARGEREHGGTRRESRREPRRRSTTTTGRTPPRTSCGGCATPASSRSKSTSNGPRPPCSAASSPERRRALMQAIETIRGRSATSTAPTWTPTRSCPSSSSSASSARASASSSSTTGPRSRAGPAAPTRSSSRARTSAAAPRASTRRGACRTTASRRSSRRASPTSSTRTAPRSGCCRSCSGRALPRARARRRGPGRPARAGGALPGRTASSCASLRDRPRDPPASAGGARRHRRHAAARAGHRRLRGASASATGVRSRPAR